MFGRAVITIVATFIVWVLALAVSGYVVMRVDPPHPFMGHPVLPMEQMVYAFLISLVAALNALYYISINSRKIIDWIVGMKK